MPDSTSFIPTGAEYIRILPEIILTIVATLHHGSRRHAKRLAGTWQPGSERRDAGLDCSAGRDTRCAYPAGRGLPADDHRRRLRDVLPSSCHRRRDSCRALLGSYLRRERADGGEYHALILFSVAGQSLMAASNELIMIFIGLEISSIATYILAGYLRDDKRNNESALKYFLLGSFATAFLLYGVAWIYGITGSTNLTEIRQV